VNELKCMACGAPGRYVFSNAIDVYDGDGSWEHLDPTDHYFVRPPLRGQIP
jgi:hypothetical protein